MITDTGAAFWFNRPHLGIVVDTFTDECSACSGAGCEVCDGTGTEEVTLLIYRKENIMQHNEVFIEVWQRVIYIIRTFQSNGTFTRQVASNNMTLVADAKSELLRSGVRMSQDAMIRASAELAARAEFGE